MNKQNLKKNRVIKFMNQKILSLFFNQDGGSMVETGLLIGFAVLIFYLLITTVENIYTWASTNVNNIFGGFT
jgi:Flp pilus assembly pilin Flp